MSQLVSWFPSGKIREIVCAVLGVALFIGSAPPSQAARPELTAAMADRMTAACMAYANAHHGAVNFWVYDAAGQVIHFARMDGAPRIASTIDPTALEAPAPGDVAVNLGNETVGRVRVAGMSPAEDRVCAEAALAAAAK